MKQNSKCKHDINFSNCSSIKGAYFSKRCCQNFIIKEVKNKPVLPEKEIIALIRTEIFEICESILQRKDSSSILTERHHSLLYLLGYKKITQYLDIIKKTLKGNSVVANAKHSVDKFGFGGSYGEDF
jgi:hypothetical protein